MAPVRLPQIIPATSFPDFVFSCRNPQGDFNNLIFKSFRLGEFSRLSHDTLLLNGKHEVITYRDFPMSIPYQADF
jgi:hypothetical protein